MDVITERKESKKLCPAQNKDGTCKYTGWYCSIRGIDGIEECLTIHKTLVELCENI